MGSLQPGTDRDISWTHPCETQEIVQTKVWPTEAGHWELSPVWPKGKEACLPMDLPLMGLAVRGCCLPIAQSQGGRGQ